MKKIKFKQLSFMCKIGIFGGWVVLLVYISAFLIGMIEGVLGL